MNLYSYMMQMGMMPGAQPTPQTDIGGMVGGPQMPKMPKMTPYMAQLGMTPMPGMNMGLGMPNKVMPRRMF